MEQVIKACNDALPTVKVMSVDTYKRCDTSFGVYTSILSDTNGEYKNNFKMYLIEPSKVGHVLEYYQYSPLFESVEERDRVKSRISFMFNSGATTVFAVLVANTNSALGYGVLTEYGGECWKVGSLLKRCISNDQKLE